MLLKQLSKIGSALLLGILIVFGLSLAVPHHGLSMPFVISLGIVGIMVISPTFKA